MEIDMNSQSSHRDDEYEDEFYIDESDIFQEIDVDEEELVDADEHDEEEQGGGFIDEADDSFHIFTGHTGEVYTVTCSPADASLLATGGGDDRVFMWKIGQDDFSFELQGKLICTGSKDATLRIWDPKECPTYPCCKRSSISHGRIDMLDYQLRFNSCAHRLKRWFGSHCEYNYWKGQELDG